MNQAGEASVNVPTELSKKEFAQFRKCSAAYISKLIKLGKLAPPAITPFGRINVAEALAMLESSVSQPSPEPIAEPGKPAAPRYADERVRREQAMATLAELELQERQGKLVDREAYDRQVESRLRQLRDRILSVPRDIAAECARLAEEIPIEARILAALKMALTEVSADASLESAVT